MKVENSPSVTKKKANSSNKKRSKAKKNDPQISNEILSENKMKTEGKADSSITDLIREKSSEDTEKDESYDDFTKLILEDIAEAVASRDLRYWKNDFIRENIYRKGGIAKKRYDEMRKAHYQL